jgi:hypothetical protein
LSSTVVLCEGRPTVDTTTGTLAAGTRYISIYRRQHRRHTLNLRPFARPWQGARSLPSRGLRPTSRAGTQAATKESNPEERGEDRRHPAWQPHRRSNQPWTRLRHSSDQEEALDVWLGSEGGTRTAARPVQDAPAVDLRGGASVDTPLYDGSCLSFLKRSASTLLSGAPPPRPSVPVGRGRSALLVLSARPACSGATSALLDQVTAIAKNRCIVEAGVEQWWVSDCHLLIKAINGSKHSRVRMNNTSSHQVTLVWVHFTAPTSFPPPSSFIFQSPQQRTNVRSLDLR